MTTCPELDHTGLVNKMHSCTTCTAPIEPLICYALYGECEKCILTRAKLRTNE